MDSKIKQSALKVTVDGARMAICAECGTSMTYKGPEGVDLREAERQGAYYECKNGHIEACEPNN